MERTVEVQATGLFTHPNPKRLPKGAQRLAENAVIDREGVIGRRRGFSRYGDALSNPASALSEYQSRIVLLDGSTVKYDSDGAGTWASYSGTHTPPGSQRMQFLESNENLYFTTDRGPYVVDALAGTPIRSGIPEGLDMQLTLTGVGGGWNLVNSTVGYVHTWKRKDANENSKQGSPSFQRRVSNSYTTSLAWTRVTTTATVAHTAHGFTTGDVIVVAASSDTAAITNGSKTITVTGANAYTFTCINAGAASGTLSAGKDYTVSLTWTVPDDAVAGDIWELWRTDLTAAAGDPVGGDYRLIASAALTSAEKTAGTITYLDDNDSSFLGEPLYTNAGEQTDRQKNHRPPLARFVAQLDGYTFWCRTSQPEELQIQLNEVSGLVDDTSSITVTSGATTLTYTFSTAENQGARKFKRWTTFSTLAQNLEATMESFCKIVNRDTGNTLIVAQYISGEDDIPGKVLLEKKTVGTSLFTLIANNSTTGGKFFPVIPTSGSTVQSTSTSRANRIHRSKRGQPEACPKLNFMELGRRNKDILGVQALEDKIFVWKEDGLFVISGQGGDEAGSGFVDDEADQTAILTAPGTATVLDNSAMGFTLQGQLKAGQGPPALISTPSIQTDVLRIAQFDNFGTLAHAIGYESDHKLLLFVPETRADSTCTIAYVWNYLTNSWTTWRKPVAAAHVLSGADLLYLAHAVDAYVLQERKALDTSGNDFVDEEVAATITAVSTTTHPETGRTVSLVTLTYTYSEDLVAGFLLVQGTKRSKIDVVTSLGGTSYQVTCRNRLSFTAAACTVGLSIPFYVEWAPITRGDALALKQIGICSILPERGGGTYRMGFQSDLKQQRSYTKTIIRSKAKGWGSPGWGGAPWGDSSPGEVNALRTMVPRDQQLCRSLAVRLENVYAKEQVDILQLSLDLRFVSTSSQRA